MADQTEELEEPLTDCTGGGETSEAVCLSATFLLNGAGERQESGWLMPIGDVSNPLASLTTSY